MNEVNLLTLCKVSLYTGAQLSIILHSEYKSGFTPGFDPAGYGEDYDKGDIRIKKIWSPLRIISIRKRQILHFPFLCFPSSWVCLMTSKGNLLFCEMFFL